MRAPFLMALLGSPSRGWLGVAPTSSGDLDELQPISLIRRAAHDARGDRANRAMNRSPFQK